jgi:hypothetical protein
MDTSDNAATNAKLDIVSSVKKLEKFMKKEVTMKPLIILKTIFYVYIN